MKKNIIATAVGIATLGLAATATASIEEGQLTIWINGDKGYNGLAVVGNKFTDDTGITVTVAHPDDVPGKFTQAAATGAGPDIIFWAHDRFGEWAESGLLTTVTPSADIVKNISQVGWDAATLNGKVYGYPVAMEAVGLIYNKALVKEAPKTWEEIPALDKELQKQGKNAILWDYNNTYFTWGLMAADGGYVFGQSDAGYDVKDTGVNNAGAIAGVEVIKSLIDNGHMPKGADYSVMDAAFAKGEVAMIINGPWSWSNYEKSGIDFGVTTLPSLNGSAGKPFVGVLTAGINAASPNKDLAVEFLENYFLTMDGLQTVNDDVALGAVAYKPFQAKLNSNPMIAATMANAEAGNPMPAVPEMGKFWSAMENALRNVTEGRQDVQAALDTAAKRILK